jgi:electron transfer flavoprotein beta subunit
MDLSAGRLRRDVSRVLNAGTMMMRYAVCLSRLPDPNTVEVDPLTGEIDLSRILFILNPADAAALELVLRLRAPGETVTALTVGPGEAEGVLREALAVGADQVLRVWEEGRTATRPAASALLLATALQTQELPDLVVCGARTLAGGSGKVPALIAEYLDWPVVTDVAEFRLEPPKVSFQRRLPKGARSEGEVTLPAVLAVDAGAVALRYASLPGLMKAKRADIPVRHLADLGLSPVDLNFPSATVQAAMPPYHRPREVFIPDSMLPPHERVMQVLSAGVARKAGQIVSGPPEEMADAILAFLGEQGFVEGPA